MKRERVREREREIEREIEREKIFWRFLNNTGYWN